MKRKSTIQNFGKRLAVLRKEKGFTLAKLGEKVGVSYRVIAYYELESKYPPTHLIVPLAKALNVSTDELLGLKNIKHLLDPEHATLWRKLKKAESLSKKDKKALFDFLDALLVRSKSKK